MSPANGQVGVVVTITGTDLLAGGTSLTSVTLDGTAATVQTESETQVVVVAASSAAGTGDVVLTSNSGAVVTLSNGFTYDAESAITSVTPDQGQLGTLVTIVGTNLLGASASAGAEITTATLGSLNANIVFGNQTYVVLTVNNGTAGVVDVTLEATSGATTVRSNGFTYTAIGQIDTVTPNNGQIGTSIEIVGARMLGGGAEASSVTLAGEAAFISSSTATKVEIIAVSGAAGTGDVVITSNTGAVVTSVNGFTYTTAGVIATVTPNFGQVGTEVSIAGSALQGSGSNVATVTLAGEAASITSENDTLVVVAAAQGLAKTGDVVLTSDSGAVITKSNGFTYRTEGDITGVSPSSGQIGTIVTIAGSALQGYGGSIVTVTLGSATATIVTETNTEAVIVATAGPTAETAVDVKLTSDSGAVVTSVNGFTYLEPGEITVVRPASGQVDTELVISWCSAVRWWY